MNADGSRLTQVTFTARGTYVNFAPAWSPDGAWLAFSSTCPDCRINVMNVDGSTVREIARYDIQLAWSPDATTIAFSLQDDNGLENIAVISADVLTISAGTVISSGNDETPAWRPRSVAPVSERAPVQSCGRQTRHSQQREGYHEHGSFAPNEGHLTMGAPNRSQ